MTNLITWLLVATTIAVIAIYQARRRRRQRVRLRIAFIINHLKVKGDNMAATLTVVQQIGGTVEPVDRLGNPAKVETGSVSYESSDEDVFIVEEDPDNELNFTVKAVGPGVGELRVSADADLGDGVRTIETYAAVEVFPEEAIGFGIRFGTPVDQPEESPESPAESPEA